QVEHSGPHEERNPAQQDPEALGDQGIKAVAVVVLHPLGVAPQPKDQQDLQGQGDSQDCFGSISHGYAKNTGQGPGTNLKSRTVKYGFLILFLGWPTVSPPLPGRRPGWSHRGWAHNRCPHTPGGAG